MKKTIQKSISLLLTLCMVLSLCTPALATDPRMPEQTAAEENTTQMVEILPQEEETDPEPLQADAVYEANFDTAENRGGWALDAGVGSIAFTDGAGAAGYATMSTGGGNSAFVATDAPSLKNGFVEADITPTNNKQFALAFRYVNADSYVAISRDSDGWGWCGNGGTTWGKTALSTEHPVTAGTKLHLRVEYVEELVRVLVDGEEIFYGVLPTEGSGDNSTATLPTGAGKCGFRTWGSGSDATVKIDNVRMGALTEIVPTQHAVTVVNGTATPTTAAMGATVSITANAPEGEETFRSWTSSNGVVFANAESPTTTFTMPAGAVTVTATYSKPGAEGGLVLHSTFDVGDRSATEIFNLVDESHKGTIGGAVAFVPGIRGEAIKIDNGGGDAVNHVDYGTKFDAMMGKENFSVAVWVKSGDTSQNDRAILGNKDWGNGKNKGMTVPYINGELQPNFGSGSARVDNKGVGGQDGEWHHLVVTVDRSGAMTSYLDGRLVTTNSMSGLSGKDTSTGLPFVLGGDGKKKWSASSTLDELRIYDRALTKEEATNIFTMDGGALIELGRLEEAVDSIKPSDRITAEAIAAFKTVLSEAKAELETLTDTAEILTLIADLQAQYNTLLEGTGHLAKFVAFSDVHSGDVAARNQKFVKAMEDMQSVAPDAIAMLNGGDFGESTEAAHKGFFKTMEDNCPYEDEKVIVALGNHDVRVNGDSWHSNPDYPDDFKGWPAIKARYLELNAPYMPVGNDEVYFSKKLGGYTFIVLNTELGLKDDMYMSAAQVAWFEETMKAAYEEDANKPVFILGHQALGETHWPNPKEYPFSPQNTNADAQVKEIMRKYPVGTFLSGHLHNGLGYSPLVNTDYGALIDVPSLLQPEGRGYSREGAGFVAYIYEDEVLWRARNFLTKEWLPEYDITVKMSEMPKLSATVEDDEAGMTYSTGAGKAWTREAPYHAADLAWPTTAETQYPSVTLTFDGTGITLYGHKIANGATMSVTVDGEDAGTADFYAPTVTYNADSKRPVPGIYGVQASAKVFEVSGLERGQHTVVLTMANTKNDAAQPVEGVLRAAIDYAKINYAKGYPAGTTFYVDSVGGDDSNEGTNAAAPWKTLEKVNALTLKPGDRVLLKAGSVFEGQSLSLRGSGSKERPILVDMYNGATVGAEAGAKPHIKANGVAKAPFTMGNESNTGTTSYSGIAYGLHIKNMSYITVKNLEVTNTNGQNMTVDKVNGRFHVGVVVETESGQGLASGIHLDSLYVHDVNGDRQQKTAPNGGIYFITTAPNGDVTHPTRYNDISIQNCTVADVSRTGISVGSSHSANKWEKHPGGMIPQEVKTNFGHTNVLIKNNFVQNAGGDAIVPQFCIAPLIEYNISDHASQNSGKDGGQYNAAIWPWRCEDAIFQFNEAFSTKNNGDGQAYDCDSSRGTTYQYNYSHDNEGGFMLLCLAQSVESTVRYNISQNDHDSLFLVSNTTPADIYNNTFYVGPKLTKIVDGGSPSNLKNNIFYNASGKPGMAGWGNFTYDNNLYYGFDSTPTDANKITANPLFVDPGKGGSGVAGNSAIDTLTGYKLLEGSPAIAKGVVIPNNGGKDYFGNTVSATEKPNIGAFEGVSTPVAVTKVELDRESLNLVSNGAPHTATLVATVTPETAANKAVTWHSSDEAVATVDANGVVTAKFSGTATITVTTVSGGLTDTCAVTVTTIDTTSPSTPTKPKPPVTEGENTTVTADVKPTVSGDKATANVSTKTVTDAVASAAKAAEESGTSANVELAIKAPEKAKTVEVSLPKAAVEAIIKGKTENLIITSPVGEISLDSKALSAIGEAAGSTVKIAITASDASKTETAEQAKLGGAAVFDLTITSGSNTISDFKEGKATVTVPHTLAEGRDAKFVTVWYLAEGKLSPVESTYTDGKASFSTGHFSRYAIGYLPFEDVQAGWYYDSVVYAYNTELFGGIGQNKFAPGDNMTRGALWTVLYRMADATTKGEGDAWYADARAWAVAEGVSDGANPDGNITREQLATILYRYAKGAPATVDMSKFADTADISGFAADAMTWAVERGLLQGADGKLNPQGNASRAEVAIMLQRFVETGAK